MGVADAETVSKSYPAIRRKGWFEKQFLGDGEAYDRVLIVHDVLPNGKFAQAGFRRSDVMDTINGEKIKSESDIREAIKRSAPRKAKVIVLRNNKPIELELGPGVAGFGRFLERFVRQSSSKVVTQSEKSQSYTI